MSGTRTHVRVVMLSPPTSVLRKWIRCRGKKHRMGRLRHGWEQKTVGSPPSRNLGLSVTTLSRTTAEMMSRNTPNQRVLTYAAACRGDSWYWLLRGWGRLLLCLREPGKTSRLQRLCVPPALPKAPKQSTLCRGIPCKRPVGENSTAGKSSLGAS